jgi:4-hydroxy-2-oxoglutarate aldolase
MNVSGSTTDMNDLKVSGIFPPLTTPFDQRGEVDYSALPHNVEHYNETGLSGYVALGSNGEAIHLDNEERRKVIETIKRAATPGHVIIAGVNELSTRGAIAATREAADSGADAALVVTPYYYKSSMTQEVLIEFYSEVAAQSPVPILIYNVPQNTGVVIESATIARLATNPGIVGVKDSAGNFGAIAETIRLAPEGFSVLAGNGGVLYPALAMGAAGAVLAVACAAPRACVELFNAVRDGQHEKARELQNRIAPLSHTVTAGFGVAGLKAAMGVAGLEGGHVRAPLAPLASSALEKIRSTMRASGLFPTME